MYDNIHRNHHPTADHLSHRSSSTTGHATIPATPTQQHTSYGVASPSPYYYAPTPVSATPFVNNINTTNGSSNHDDDDDKKKKKGGESIDDIDLSTLNTVLGCCFWIPSVVCLGILRSDVGESLLRGAAFCGLIVYGLDLANLRRLSLAALGLSCVLPTLVLLRAAAPATMSGLFAHHASLVVMGIFFITTILWVMLQYEGLPESRRRKVTRAVGGLLPPLTAALLTVVCLQQEQQWLDVEIMAPYLYMSVFLLADVTLSSSSIRTPSTRAMHRTLQVMMPGILQLFLCWGHAHLHRLDILLAFVMPWLLSFKATTPNNSKKMIKTVLAMIAAAAIQQRYLVPFFQRHAFRIAGTHISTLSLSLYWTLCMVAAFAAWSIHHHQSHSFGEYQDDITQLCLAVAGVGLGKGMGLSWTMTPLPVLGVLGVSLWISTRMVRYLAIVLFVVHATAVVVFTYRFVGLESTTEQQQSFTITLAVLEKGISLTQFGMIVTGVSLLWLGMIMGLAVRSHGGWGTITLRKYDVTGIMMIMYVGLLMIVEMTLLKRKRPLKELAGMDADDAEYEESSSLYHANFCFLTSAVLVGLLLFMKQARMVKPWSAALSISLALGKAVGIFCHTFSNNPLPDPTGQRIFVRSITAAMLCAILFTPGAFLRPVHVKQSRRNATLLPPQATRTVVLYCFVMVPLSLVACTPAVIIPLVKALLHLHHRDLYYNASNPWAEFLGITVSLWGLACLILLRHYLPDGGAEAWKKLAGLAFLTGIGLLAIGPSLGMGSTHNPYASISSVGLQLAQRGKSRTGGWGLLAAALATLLAVTGPLELKERRTGRKDRFLLFRTMVFGVLFGGGIAWFVTLQNMNQTSWFSLAITLLATLALAFIGTVASVLGYFVELENMEEAEQIAKTWVLAFLSLLPIAGLPQLLPSSSQDHAFGVGGWLSTYLTVAGLFATIFSVAVGRRESKNVSTRSMGNAGCLIGWGCFVSVVFGRFGLGQVEEIRGISDFVRFPASVSLTFVLAPLLLLLQGEKMRGRSSRRTTVPHQYRTSSSSTPGITLSQLSDDTRWFPLFLGTVMVFVIASIYAVLFRGFFYFFTPPTTQQMEGFATPPPEEATSLRDESSVLKHLEAEINLAGLQSAPYTAIDRAGLWTSSLLRVPLFHICGILTVIPCLYRLTQRYLWTSNRTFTEGIPMTSVGIAASSLLFCFDLPTLQAAALLTAACGGSLLMEERRREEKVRMQI